MMRPAILLACALLLAPGPALSAGRESSAPANPRPLSISVNAQALNQVDNLLRDGDAVYALAVRLRGPGEDGPRWAEGPYRAAGASLDSIRAGRLRKMLVFSSREDLERALSSLPAGLDAVAYETGPSTPEEELKNLEGSLKRFADTARKKRLPVEWRPSASVAAASLRSLPKLVRHVDAVVFDNQEALGRAGYGEFARLTREQAELVRQGKPACRVGIFFRIGSADADKAWRALAQVRDVVDHLSFFSVRSDGTLKILMGRLR